MKKQFLLPMVAIMLAVGGAYASNQFTPIYYQGGDDSCTIVATTEACEPGVGVPCYDTTNNLQHYYKMDEESDCLELFKN